MSDYPTEEMAERLVTAIEKHMAEQGIPNPHDAHASAVRIVFQILTGEREG